MREKAPGLAQWQTRLAWLLGWWVVPITIALLWWRSLVVRLAWLTAIQLLSLGVSVTASLYFISIASATLCGAPTTLFDNLRQWLFRASFPRKLIWAALVTAALSVFSIRVFHGARIPLMPRYAFNANLRYARLSPADTAEGSERRAISLIGWNLLGCNASDAEMAKVDLSGANLSGCNFDHADLRNADLTAELHNAILDGANLRGARLAPRSDVPNMEYADVQGAVISTKGLPQLLFNINNLALATWYIPPHGLLELGLPEDHNVRVAKKDLSGYDFSKVQSFFMQRADLKGWIRRNGIFAYAFLEGADLSRSDLRDTRFDNASLDGADLRGADLSQAQGLTQWQLNSAITGKSDITGKNTELPPGLHGPPDR